MKDRVVLAGPVLEAAEVYNKEPQYELLRNGLLAVSDLTGTVLSERKQNVLNCCRLGGRKSANCVR